MPAVADHDAAPDKASSTAPLRNSVLARINDRRRPRPSATWKHVMLPNNAPNVADDVITPCKKLLFATLLCHDTPEYSDDFSCDTTALVPPMSYPNSNPPNAGKKKIKNALIRLYSPAAVALEYT
jgi:hypothetical protein